jgi:hypothetical protein
MPYENPIVIFDRNKTELEYYLVEEFGLIKEWNALLQARATEDPKEVAWAAHYAWELLPDSPRIRHHPFSQLCNMAEQAFGEI